MDMVYNLLCGFGLDRLVRRATRPKGLIFMGHSVGPRAAPASHGSPFRTDFDPNKKWRVSSEQLDSAIRCAIDYGYEGVTIDVALERMQSSKQHNPFFVLTFDDGYVDNLTHALPVCVAHDVPLLTYVTSGFVQRTHVAWWHALEFLISDQEALIWHWQAERHQLVCRTAGDKYAAFERMSTAFTLASPMAIKISMENLRSSYGDAAWQYAADLFLTEAQLLEFAKQQGVQVGVHTVSHGALTAMDKESIDAELELCQRYLTAAAGISASHLAYPFGSPKTVSAAVFKAAQQQGYFSAVTTQHGAIFGKGATPMALPRVILAPSDTVNSLRCKLSGLTTLIARGSTRTPTYAA